MSEEKKSFLKRLGKNGQYLLLAAGVSVMVSVLSLSSVYDTPELKAVDLRFTLRNAIFGPPRQYDKLATVDIDDITLSRLGKFEDWNRVRFAEVVDHAFDLGALAFVEDFLFIEHSLRRLTYDQALNSDASSRDEVLALFPDPDSILAETYLRNKKVFIGSFFYQSDHTDYDRAVATMVPRDSQEREARFQAMLSSSLPMTEEFQKNWFVASDMGAPVAVIANAAKGVGHASPSEDKDGIVRRYRLFYVYDGRLFASLALITACDIMGVPLENIKLHEDEVIIPGALPPGEEEPRDIHIPINSRGEMMTNWAGPYGETFRHFPHVALLDVHTVNEEAKVAAAAKRLIWRSPEMADEIVFAYFGGDPLELIDQVLAGLPTALTPEQTAQVISDIGFAALFERQMQAGFSFEDVIGQLFSDLFGEPVTLADMREFADEDPLSAGLVEVADHVWLRMWNGLETNLKIAAIVKTYPQLTVEAVAETLGIARPEEIHEGYYSIHHIIERVGSLSPQEHPLVFKLLIVDGKPIRLEEFQDAILFHGITAVGGADRNPTPFETRYPMVGLHVNILNSMLTGDFLQQVSEWVNLLFIIVIGLLMGVFIPRLSAGLGAVLLIGLLVGFSAIALLLFRFQGIVIDVVGAMSTGAFAFLAITILRYVQEEKEKKYIKDAFSSYLAPEVVAQLVEDPSRLQLGGDRKNITIMFTDVAGFSTISEALSAEDLVILLNEYLTEMCEIIFEFGGTVDKFEGDLIMAFFGAPMEYPDHAERACLACLKMSRKLDEMRVVWRAEGRHELYARLGLNTGDAVVGNMGSKQRMDYTVMGDAVNLAARLEGANKPYGTSIMVSGQTYEAAKNAVEGRLLDYITVVGRSEPVAVYEIMCAKGELDDNGIAVREIYENGLRTYRAEKWEEAIGLFNDAIAINDDPPSHTIMKRCEAVIAGEIELEEGWGGVWSLTEK